MNVKRIGFTARSFNFFIIIQSSMFLILHINLKTTKYTNKIRSTKIKLLVLWIASFTDRRSGLNALDLLISKRYFAILRAVAKPLSAMSTRINIEIVSVAI